MYQSKNILILFLFLNASVLLQSQTLLDSWYCSDFSNFEPFEYDESTKTFTFNLAENCDPNHNGDFWFNELTKDSVSPTNIGENYRFQIQGLEKGEPAHYAFIKRPQTGNVSTDPNAVAWGGVELNHDEHKGRILLILDKALELAISDDFKKYKETLVGDGWKISVLLTDENSTIQTTKAAIQQIYDTEGDLKSFFILGDVPIPFSGGNIAPDGHWQTSGAWMSDSYYADLDGVWTDNSATTTVAQSTINHNAPGDGKFDQNTVPSSVELEFGRIHFENMTIFDESREELYARYLQKNINYRKGKVVADNDYFLHANSAAFPSSMHKALNLINGTAPLDKKFEQIGNKIVLDHLPIESYHYASINGFGAPGGQWINGRVGSSDFKNDSLQAIFLSLAASNIGNWSNASNLLNAACASKGTTIMANWSVFALPLHYLYSGHTYGFCLKTAMQQNRSVANGNWHGFRSNAPETVSHNLVGDPSLKFFVSPPVDAISLLDTDNQVEVIWTDSSAPSKIKGYNVYRASSISGDFSKINNEIITSDYFVDENPIYGNAVYSVRSVRLDSSMVASYFTYSNGVMDSVFRAPPVIDLDGDGFADADDCDDQNPNVNPAVAETPYNGIDDDCDPLTPDDDLDGDGFNLADDCDDTNANINTAVAETPYNGIDDDCDPLTPDDDLDGDGFNLADDCDDTNANINTAVAEIPYNGIDDDCDPLTPDDDLDSDGFNLADDCDDTNANINTAVAENPYNGIDDDCDPLTPDDDLDGDGFNLADDCDDTNANINTAVAETPYNGIDDDCDPLTPDDDLDGDGFNLADDCDDTNANINTAVAETPYNGIDDDCDPLTPDDDLDGDGFNLADDCDDTNPNINTAVAETPYNGIDDDCDPLTPDDDLDGDGFNLADDCDDTNPNINTAVAETPYNGIDDDCDPLTPDDDLDGDGFNLADDCDDTNANINTAVAETPYNGIDDDCDPLTPDDDLDGDGFNLADDCDDTNANINTAVAEIPYNGIDDDCDPLTPDDDLDGDGFNLADDCDDTNPNINTAVAETPYNGIDDDCDPLTPDDDLDGDGFNLADDCDDTNANINTAVAETPYNGIDDDCDPLTPDDDLDGDGFNLADDCDDTNSDVNPNGIEIPNNGIDENCDGMDGTVSTKNIEIVGLKIYPNPVSEFLNIDVPANLEYSVRLYDLTGNLISSNKNIQKLNVQNLAEGAYLIEVLDLNSARRTVERVVVMK